MDFQVWNYYLGENSLEMIIKIISFGMKRKDEHFDLEKGLCIFPSGKSWV